MWCRSFVGFLVCGLTAFSSFAQFNMGFQAWDGIPVVVNGDTLPNAWAGGLNAPQFSQVDIDLDGQKDLFVFDRQGNTVSIFLNTGGPGQIQYKHAPGPELDFPVIENFAVFQDYNCDGKADLFTSRITGMIAYRNDSDTEFTLTRLAKDVPVEVNNLQAPLPIFPLDIPAFSDVDNDGDIDMLAFGSSGIATATTVAYYRNVSMDRFGNCETLLFEVGSECWDNFQESASANTITLGPCKKKGSQAHAGSTMLIEDLTGDGVKEAIIGDIAFPTLVYLENGGDENTANIISQETGFPANDVPVNLPLFPAPFYLDIDNDNTKELIVAPNIGTGGESLENVWLYENGGSTNLPDFNFTTNRFLSNQMIEVGAEAVPVVADVNGDSLVDLLVGQLGDLDTASGITISSLDLFLNVGTAQQPVFERISTDFGMLSQYNFTALHPTVGDLDGDGDLDMIAGEEQGTLVLFENLAGPGNLMDLMPTQANFAGIDVGLFSTPQLVDVNRDGVLDLIVGNRGGTLDYFENQGSVNSISFSSTPTIANFGGIDVEPICCEGNSKPWLTDQLDNSGDYHLVVGAENGKVYVYGNVENNLSGTFTLIDSMTVRQYRPAITGADLNNDGTLELLIGEHAGGIGLYQRVIDAPLGTKDQPPTDLEWDLFPNPATQTATITWEPISGSLHFYLIDLLGKTQFSTPLQGGAGQHTVNLSSLPAGLYLSVLETPHGRTMKKLVKK